MNRKAKAMEFIDEGYNVKITGRHLEVTDAMKQYALEKVSRVERFSNRIIDVNVIMDIQKYEHRAEIILKVNHTTIRSQAITQDMYASIDKAVEKIESQLRRYKTKLQNHHAKSLAVVDMNVNVFKKPEEEWEIDDLGVNGSESEFQPHEIVKQKTLPLKILTADEAIMKMELSNDSFLIFKSEEADQKLRIIYRREDGNYGIIEPEV